jgi:hypothetical protein
MKPISNKRLAKGSLYWSKLDVNSNEVCWLIYEDEDEWWMNDGWMMDEWWMNDGKFWEKVVVRMLSCDAVLWAAVSGSANGWLLVRNGL